MTQAPQDARFMQVALTMGRRHMGLTGDNPSVGCVIVRDNRILARAATGRGGAPHAEIQALKAAGDVTGATAYVTLEPCSHHGRTPPCANALIEAGIERVVIAAQDPNPKVNGQGVAVLRNAGLSVTEGVLQTRAEADLRGFLKRIRTGLPSITLKLATSIDGRIATSSGDSQWITSAQARRYVHMLRAQHDAIMIGSGTALADDPDLRVRALGLPDRSPVRVVIDTHLRSDTNGRLAQTAAQTPHWIVHGPDADTQKWQTGATRLIPCPTVSEGVDLHAALMNLGQEGLSCIFCEGGGGLAASLLRLGLVDRLITMTGGVAIGGDGLPSLKPMLIRQLGDAQRFECVRSFPLGSDVVTEWQPV